MGSRHRMRTRRLQDRRPLEYTVRAVAVRREGVRVFATLRDGREVWDNDVTVYARGATAETLDEPYLFSRGCGVRFERWDIDLNVYYLAKRCGLVGDDGRLTPRRRRIRA